MFAGSCKYRKRVGGCIQKASSFFPSLKTTAPRTPPGRKHYKIQNSREAKPNPFAVLFLTK